MSNAHVVAGTNSVTVESAGQTYDASVVSYDPNADISILAVPDMPAAPLVFASNRPRPVTTRSSSGTRAVGITRRHRRGCARSSN